MFSIPCSVLAAATFSPAGFAVQIFSSEMGLYCARTFSSRCSSLSLIHLPLEPHVSFKSPPTFLSSVLILFSCTFQTAAFLPASLPSVSAVNSVYPEEGKNISEPTNVKKFLRELSAPLPDGSFGMKVVAKAMGFHLFIYFYKNPGKQMCFIWSKILKQEKIWSAITYILYPNKKAVSVDVVLLIFHWRMKNKHFKWQKCFFLK